MLMIGAILKISENLVNPASDDYFASVLAIMMVKVMKRLISAILG